MEHRDTPLASQATTDAYVDLDQVVDARGAYGSVLVLDNTGTKSITFQLLGSVNKSAWAVLSGPTAILASAQGSASTAAPWPWLKVQVKSTASGQASAVQGAVSSLF